MQPFDQALAVIAGVMRDGVARQPDNEWTRRSIEYHIGQAEEHLRLLRENEQLEDPLVHVATRLLMALTCEKLAETSRAQEGERLNCRSHGYSAVTKIIFGPIA